MYLFLPALVCSRTATYSYVRVILHVTVHEKVAGYKTIFNVKKTTVSMNAVRCEYYETQILAFFLCILFISHFRMSLVKKATVTFINPKFGKKIKNSFANSKKLKNITTGEISANFVSEETIYFNCRHLSDFFCGRCHLPSFVLSFFRSYNGNWFQTEISTTHPNPYLFKKLILNLNLKGAIINIYTCLSIKLKLVLLTSSTRFYFLNVHFLATNIKNLHEKLCVLLDTFFYWKISYHSY